MTSDVRRHELQGAYLAQRRASLTTGAQPLIRLLVAHAGEGNQRQQPVVDQLLNKVEASEQLVAVAGLGASGTDTLQAISTLDSHGIAMIASRLTGDDLRVQQDGHRIDSLVRCRRPTATKRRPQSPF